MSQNVLRGTNQLVNNSVNRVADSVGTGIGAGHHVLDSAIRGTTGVADNIVDHTHRVIRNTTSNVGNLASNTVRRVGNTVGNTVSDIGNIGADAIDTVHGLATDTLDGIGHVAKSAVHGTRILAEDLVDSAHDVTHGALHSSKGIVSGTGNNIDDLFVEGDTFLGNLLRNQTVSYGIKIVLIAYIAFFASNLSQASAMLMDSTFVRIIFAALIILFATHDPIISLLMVIAFLVSLQTANRYKVKEVSESFNLSMSDIYDSDVTGKKNSGKLIDLYLIHKNPILKKDVGAKNFFELLQGNDLETEILNELNEFMIWSSNNKVSEEETMSFIQNVIPADYNNLLLKVIQGGQKPVGYYIKPNDVSSEINSENQQRNTRNTRSIESFFNKPEDVSNNVLGEKAITAIRKSIDNSCGESCKIIERLKLAYKELQKRNKEIIDSEQEDISDITTKYNNLKHKLNVLEEELNKEDSNLNKLDNKLSVVEQELAQANKNLEYLTPRERCNLQLDSDKKKSIGCKNKTEWMKQQGKNWMNYGTLLPPGFNTAKKLCQSELTPPQFKSSELNKAGCESEYSDYCMAIFAESNCEENNTSGSTSTDTNESFQNKNTRNPIDTYKDPCPAKDCQPASGCQPWTWESLKQPVCNLGNIQSNIVSGESPLICSDHLDQNNYI